MAGLAVLPFLPGATGAVIRLESVIALRLPGPSRAEEPARRVEDLAERRAGTLAAADAERRRIERDLHDGAQQRLVSLAVNLGLARATLTDLPPETRAVIDEAHREAKEALEAMAYFVVSEALANVTKHARASRAEVVAVRAGDAPRVRVTDDGGGGADPFGGTGLTGLARRVASVDGTLAIDSPPGA
ncbi:hypothetical protein GCM10009864_19460 [Streptomyces lunalinharesii]|uniref:histidine kinase n=1 Tax=Streptomyces lunalinharesii TaxID=333384 RepID=A0ABN3RK76_9ACTN